MDPNQQGDRPSRLTVAMADLAVAAVVALLGLVVIFDSRRIGTGWADDGPQAGYFPFYIGILMTGASVVVFFHTLHSWVEHRAWFATVNQLRHVYSVLLPTCIYVGAIYLVGIYLASAVFIGWFMMRHGKFGWLLALPVSVGVPLFLFMLFEKWFLVPLPKGPLERLLGY